MNQNNINWLLGFSLSAPTMDDTSSSSSHHHHQEGDDHQPSSTVVSATVPSSYNYPGINYYGENSSSSLTMMPIKSDGSLCLMEAFHTSQPPAKREDFFSTGATMGAHAHHYERGGMALSLDSTYYNQTHENENSKTLINGQDFVGGHSQENSQEIIQLHHQEYPHYNNYQALLLQGGGDDHHHRSKEADQAPSMAAEDEIGGGGAKNWVSRNCSPGNVHAALMAENGVEMESGGAGGNGDLQSLSLTMSSQDNTMMVLEKKKRGLPENQKQIVHRKSIDTFGQRTSQYRGVTRHRWTGRYEAHLWDNSCKKEGQSRKGRQVYLGGYDMEEKAARAYDLAALKYWGPSTHINFAVENYRQELEDMNSMNRQEYVAHLRRRSSGFSRGASIYRGVTRHHQHGRWQARIGRVAGNKDLYLGTFSTQEEAAEAYDVAAIKFRGLNAVTNFVTSKYDVERIMESNTLLSGEMARRNTDVTTLTVSHPTDDVALYEPSHHQKPALEYFNGSSSSVSGSVVIDPQVWDGAGRSTAGRLSGGSSLVTSLSSSREGSPDGNINNSRSMQFGSEFSWIQSTAQMRPQVPLFYAWADAS
ncbi:hypothetical protein ACP275_12G022800 [Erythranthe tilingii]